MCDAVFRLRSPPVLRGWQRSQQKVNGVPLIDHGAVHLDFDVEVVTLTGKFRALVVVARQLLGVEWKWEVGCGSGKCEIRFFESRCYPLE